MPLPVPFDVFVVLAVIGVTLVLFVRQPVPIDATAVGLMVTLILLGPWTGVSPEEGISGFSNPATVTVLAMFILSEGVRQTGVIQILTRKMESFAGTSETRQLLATVGLSGPAAGFVNNTPIVAVLIPAVTNLAKKTGTSPSKLLIPLSFASMLGGTLTVIGTSTNLLASDVWSQVGGPGAEPFSLFEFTQLGVVVLTVGTVYLLTVGRYLTPARIRPSESSTAAFGMADYLTDVVVLEESPLIGSQVRDIRDNDLDLDVFQLVRDGRTVVRGLSSERIQAGDILSVRADQNALKQVIEDENLALLPEVIDAGEDETASDEPVSDRDDSRRSESQETRKDKDEWGEVTERELTEVVLLPSRWAKKRIGVAEFEREYDVTVLAVRRGEGVIRKRLRDVRLRTGDVALVQTGEDILERLRADRSVVVSGEGAWESFDRSKIPVALGILVGVVGLAALEFLPIVVSALAGVFAMFFTGIIQPADAYDAVDWDVIFLLAGVIPLGIAVEESGTADLLAGGIMDASVVLPAVVILGIFYLGTALITEVVSNAASVVLMLPIAVEVAVRLNVNAFAFALAVTFAASTPLLTPVGYQTNLMVYGPGGYRFTDFARVGAPLQIILTFVTTLGIEYLWGL
jgi:di/tricarboxylate transporter